MFDVAVIGGGIVGASTAYALQKLGQTVALIEQYEPGHNRGSSHGDGRVVRFNYTEAIYVEMALLAYQAWDRLSEAADETLIRETGLLEYGPVGHEAIQITEDIFKQYEIAYSRLTADEAMARFPQYHFDANSEILFQPRGAVAMATPAVKALWRLFRAIGGQTYTKNRIERITVDDNKVTIVNLDGDEIAAKQVVISAGAWTKQLVKQLDLDLPLDVTQEILAYFPPQNDSINHHVGTMPVIIDYYTIPNSDAPFYSLPIVDIGGVKMGWHHSGVAMNPDDNRRIVDEIVTELKNWSERRYPHLQNEPIDIQMCLYTNTPDYHFIIDKHPTHDNVTIATGFSGHGFKFGPLLGEMIASLVLGEDAPVDLSSFEISRFENLSTLDKRVGA